MSEQDYYWTPDWQADERAAAQELDRDEGVRFSDADEAVAWLSGDEGMRRGRAD